MEGALQQELIERFIRKRVYFKNVSPSTLVWYRQSFRAFDGAIETSAAIGERIGLLRGQTSRSVGAFLSSPG
jgi:hypothetical protein